MNSFFTLQIRAFVSNPHSTSKQELNQSPLAFVETASEPGLEEALKRKDNIIRVRNAQISALWDELHTRQPWKNAIKGEDIVSFPEDAANTTRKLAVLGINTVSPHLCSVTLNMYHRMLASPAGMGVIISIEEHQQANLVCVSLAASCLVCKKCSSYFCV